MGQFIDNITQSNILARELIDEKRQKEAKREAEKRARLLLKNTKIDIDATIFSYYNDFYNNFITDLKELNKKEKLHKIFIAKTFLKISDHKDDALIYTFRINAENLNKLDKSARVYLENYAHGKINTQTSALCKKLNDLENVVKMEKDTTEKTIDLNKFSNNCFLLAFILFLFVLIYGGITGQL